MLKISINGHWVRSGYEFYHFRHQRPRYFCTAPMITTPHFTAVKQLGTRAIYALPVTSGHFPVSSHKISAVNLLHSNHLCTTVPIILPLQTFFSRVLLLRQQAFLSGNLAPESYSNKTQVFMFRSERVNSTRKFTIVVEIVSLLKKIYKRDAPFRSVFPPYLAK